MNPVRSFQPRYGQGITETATTTSTPYVIDNGVENAGGGSHTVVVSNQGNTNGLYFRIGKDSTVTATDADAYLPPGAQAAYSKAADEDYIALLGNGGSTAVHVIVGEFM